MLRNDSVAGIPRNVAPNGMRAHVQDGLHAIENIISPALIPPALMQQFKTSWSEGELQHSMPAMTKPNPQSNTASFPQPRDGERSAVRRQSHPPNTQYGQPDAAQQLEGPGRKAARAQPTVGQVIGTLKQFVPDQNHPLLDLLQQHYLSRTIDKRQLESGLRQISGDFALMKAVAKLSLMMQVVP